MAAKLGEGGEHNRGKERDRILLWVGGFWVLPLLAEGRHLFETQGCRGCHKLNGVGGSIGPDLSEEGASTRSPEWLEHYHLAPNEVSTGSAMPNFHFTKGQARALTYYMLSLTNEDMGSYYASVRLIPSPEYGRERSAWKAYWY